MTDSAILPIDSLNLLVSNGHIRFLMQTEEKYPGSWGRWGAFVAGIRNIAWCSRRGSSDRDDGVQPLVTVLPCQLCGGEMQNRPTFLRRFGWA